MANAPYEMILEQALRLACADSQEYDASQPNVVEFLWEKYFNEAQKGLTNDQKSGIIEV